MELLDGALSTVVYGTHHAPLLSALLHSSYRSYHLTAVEGLAGCHERSSNWPQLRGADVGALGKHLPAV